MAAASRTITLILNNPSEMGRTGNLILKGMWGMWKVSGNKGQQNIQPRLVPCFYFRFHRLHIHKTQYYRRYGSMAFGEEGRKDPEADDSVSLIKRRNNVIISLNTRIGFCDRGT